MKCKVIICGPAVGKTYLAKHDDRFIDLDLIKAKYKYNLDISNDNFEKIKFKAKIINSDSTEYAINFLKNELDSDKILLMSFNKTFIKYLIDNKIDYCLVYPGKDELKEYINRMKIRKNDPSFIKKVANENNWVKFYEENSNDPNATYKIELKKGQYLSDIKNLFMNKKDD